MRRLDLHLPSTWLISAVAALTTWVTLWAWAPFSERPSTFLVPLLWLSLLVAAAGAALRGARLPALGVALLQLLLLGLVLHHAWSGGLGLLNGWVPTPESLREVGAVLSASTDAAQSYPAPVPKSVPEFPPVLVLAGSATVVLVDLIACGLRRAPVAGLPLLAVYTAPVSILDGGVSWVKFALAGLLFLFLITCQEAGRLAHWGQQVTGSGRFFDTQQTPVSSRAVWSSARKIGLTATGLAVVVPILVPTWSVGLFDGNGPGSGGNSVSITNPIVDMKRDLTRGQDLDLVTVVTDDPDPRYLRVSVLDEFDGKTWKPSNRSIPVEQRADGLVPAPPGLDTGVKSTTYTWNLGLTDNFSSTWLPAPYPVFSLNAPGDWRWNRDTLDFVSGAKDQPTEGLQYQLERIDVQPTPEELAFAAPAPASIFGPGTELPDGIPARVKELAQSVTEDAPTKYEKAVALQDWFRTGGDFQYSLERAPGNGVDDLVRFLFDERVGYCEQFAGAMALMGRELAIPSRIGYGFLRPDPVGDRGADRTTYVYSAHDLHVWPEMYFDGVGWVRFEPTPGVRTGRAPSYTQQRVDRTQPSASSSASAALPTGQNRLDRSSAPAAGGRDSGGGSVWSTRAMVAGAAGMLLLLGMLALPRTARTWVRSRRWASATTTAEAAEAGWAELRDTALDLNLAFDDRRTVRTVARDLVRSFGVPGSDDDALAGATQRGVGANPDAEAALRRIVEQVERARFARDVPVEAGRVDALRDDVERCAEAMAAGVGRRRRARGTWLPASLWSRWTLRPVRRRSARIDGVGEPGVDHAV